MMMTKNVFPFLRWLIVLVVLLSWVGCLYGQHQAVAVVVPASVAPRILIAYCSDAGHTKSMAEAVARGAASVPGISVEWKTVGEIRPSDVSRYDAIVLGTPVQNANPAPEMLTFIRSWPFEGQPLQDKLGAAFTTGGGISAGEELVQSSLIHAMLVYGMVIVGGQDWKSAFGASAVTGEKPFADRSVDPMFLIKAEGLGRRVAQAAIRWKQD